MLEASTTDAPVAQQRIQDAIDHRGFSPRMKRALKRLLEGQSYRWAAQSERVGLWRDLHANAKRVRGLVEAHLVAWRQRWGEAFPSMWNRHLKRVV